MFWESHDRVALRSRIAKKDLLDQMHSRPLLLMIIFFLCRYLWFLYVQKNSLRVKNLKSHGGKQANVSQIKHVTHVILIG